MSKKRILACIAGIIVVSLSIFTYQLATKTHNHQYASYDDCVLENMKNIQSDNAAAMISRSCRGLFSEKSTFTDEELFGRK